MKDSKYSYWKVVQFLYRFIHEEKRLILYPLYVLEPLAMGLIPIVMIVFPGKVIDAVANGNTHDLYVLTGIFGISVILLYTAHHVMNSIFNSELLALRFFAGKRFNAKYRFADYRYLEDPDFQAKRSTALQALRGGMVGFEGLYRYYLRILTGFISLAGLFYIVGIFNPWIILLAFILSIAQYYISLVAKKNSFKHRDDLNERERKAFYFFKIGHDFSYGKDIRIDQMDNALIAKFKEKSRHFIQLFQRVERFEFRLNIFSVLFILILNGVTYYFVIHAYFQNVLTVGQLTMTIWAITEISLKLQTLFTEFATIKKESGYVSDFMSFMENESYFPIIQGNTPKLSNFKIEFRNVTFQYPGSDTLVLNKLNLTISSNEKLALVGINGAGKSTIVKLLCGFYHPTSGDIFIDDKNMKDFNLEDYRKQIAVVFQDVNIYAATVMENIIGDQITPDNVKRAMHALDMVGLQEKVLRFPHQENQSLLKIIDSEGTDLSGGEAQRLAIARAMYKRDTNFIVLDEPTASLDAIHEKEIYENFKDLIKDRTSIIISHRLASTRFCDKIAFLEEGQIIEYGSHNELMELPDGQYRNMFITQGKYYQKEGVSDEKSIENI